MLGLLAGPRATLWALSTAPWPKAVGAPAGVTRQSVSVPLAATQRLPSGPVMMPWRFSALLRVTAVTVPPVVILLTRADGSAGATASVPYSEYQRAPSGPLVMPAGPPAPGAGISSGEPPGGILPMDCAPGSANQMLPSGPEVMPSG